MPCISFAVNRGETSTSGRPVIGSRDVGEEIAAGTLTLNASEPVDMPLLRMGITDFIADFANWDNSTLPAHLQTSQTPTKSAHEALGGPPGTRPIVVDPFAGGGAFPFEAAEDRSTSLRR